MSIAVHVHTHVIQGTALQECDIHVLTTPYQTVILGLFINLTSREYPYIKT